MPRFRTGILWGLPLLLLACCWWARPFSETVNRQVFSTRMLSSAQITNLRVAVRHLDGTVLRPGESFSFNRIVGPRTRARGYLPAPSYLGEESPATLGGGICLLSSAVYQLALSSGLQIDRRVPHLRAIRSVPPGLDATVWYGGADLQFVNTLPTPIRLQAVVENSQLSLALQGSHRIKPARIQRMAVRRNTHEVQVTVLRDNQLVSSDLYRLGL